MKGLLGLLAVIFYFFVASFFGKRNAANAPRPAPIPQSPPPPPKEPPPPPKPAAEAVPKPPAKSAPPAVKPAAKKPAANPAAKKPAAKPAAKKPAAKPAAKASAAKAALTKPAAKKPAAKKPAAKKPAAKKEAAKVVYPKGAAFTLPSLPASFNKSYSAKSRSNPDQAYDINPGKQTCTCGPSKLAQNSFKAGDVRRLCAHQIAKLRQIKAKEHYDELTWALITLSKGDFDPHYVKFKYLGTDGLIGFDPKKDEVTVYAKPKKAGEKSGGLKGAYTKVGYNLKTGAWNKRAPAGSGAELKKAITKLFGG